MKTTIYMKTVMATFGEVIAENDVLDLKNYNRVAFVVAEEIDDVFRSMNSIDCAWWDNTNVECIEMDRSMSVGDLMYIHEMQTWFACDNTGWISVKTEGQEPKRRMDRVPAEQLA